MDRKRFAHVVGESIATGEQPPVDVLLETFTLDELKDHIAAREVIIPSAGNVAVNSSVRTQIESMLPAAYAAYTHNVSTINEGRGRGAKLKKEKLKNFTDGAMDALDEPTLVYMESVKEDAWGEILWIPKSATNAELTQAEIINLAEVNSSALGRSLYGWKERIDFLNLFTRVNLSGNNPESDSLVNHQFAPSEFNPRLFGTAAYQRRTYKALRAENPGVSIHSPALALSIGGWAIHADAGLSLPTGYDSTYDRSIEVYAMSDYDGYDYTPRSFVRNSGSDVCGSWVGGDSSGRAWVGSNLDFTA